MSAAGFPRTSSPSTKRRTKAVGLLSSESARRGSRFHLLVSVPRARPLQPSPRVQGGCSLAAYPARSLVAYLELRRQMTLLDGVKAGCPGNVICSWRISRYVQGRARGYHAEQAGTPKPAGSPL